MQAVYVTRTRITLSYVPEVMHNVSNTLMADGKRTYLS